MRKYVSKMLAFVLLITAFASAVPVNAHEVEYKSLPSKKDIFTMTVNRVEDILVTNNSKRILSYELPDTGEIKMSGCLLHTKAGKNILTGAKGLDADYVEDYCLYVKTQSGDGTYDTASVHDLIPGLTYWGVVQNLNHDGYVHDGSVKYQWYR